MSEYGIMQIGELREHLANGPVTLIHGREVSLEEACRIQELDPIIKRFGTWAVTEYGVECLTTHYAIEKARLKENDWKDHLIHKTWTVAYDVCDALDFAREYFKVVPTSEIERVRARAEELQAQLDAATSNVAKLIERLDA